MSKQRQGNVERNGKYNEYRAKKMLMIVKKYRMKKALQTERMKKEEKARKERKR